MIHTRQSLEHHAHMQSRMQESCRPHASIFTRFMHQKHFVQEYESFPIQHRATSSMKKHIAKRDTIGGEGVSHFTRKCCETAVAKVTGTRLRGHLAKCEKTSEEMKERTGLKEKQEQQHQADDKTRIRTAPREGQDFNQITTWRSLYTECARVQRNKQIVGQAFIVRHAEKSATKPMISLSCMTLGRGQEGGAVPHLAVSQTARPPLFNSQGVERKDTRRREQERFYLVIAC